jgi:hypothetical protein
MPDFSLNLIKFINDWQRGSEGIRNRRRKARKLREAVEKEELPAYYCTCDEVCFRRSVLYNESVKALLFEFV